MVSVYSNVGQDNTQEIEDAEERRPFKKQKRNTDAEDFLTVGKIFIFLTNFLSIR